MKEGVIDVLMYIFSSYADQDDNLPEDRDGIDADLRSAGFDPLEIDNRNLGFRSLFFSTASYLIGGAKQTKLLILSYFHRPYHQP